MDDVYRQTIVRAEMSMSAGAATLPKAIDIATKDFLEKGIDSIVYANGRRVNIADYVQMALRTAATRSKLQGEASRRAEYGINTVLVSQYGACSNTCLPWQGRVYIDDVWGVYTGEVQSGRGQSTRTGQWHQLLSVAVEAGLFHPNCRHTVTTFIEGVNTIPEPMDEEKTKKNYELEQHQRALERAVRKAKRMVEGLQDPAAVAAWQEKLRDSQKALRDFIAEHSDVLRRDPWRERIFSISQAPGPVPAKKGLTKQATGATIKSVGDYFTGIPDDAYKATLTQRFSNGTPEAQAAFMKRVPLNSVADGSYAKTPHYSPSSKNIYMSYRGDAQERRGAGTVYFHEHGHLIDFSGRAPMSADPAFAQALRNDFNEFMKRERAKDPALKKYDIYRRITVDLYDKNNSNNQVYSSVSDILGGLSTTNSGARFRIRGGWGHDPAYWLRTPGKTDIEQEAFAHLYEAQFDPARLKAFQEYFPSATAEFLRLLKGVI